MWNSSIKLPRDVEKTTDADGFEIETQAYLEGIPANFTDVTRNDEILANQAGYSADQVVEIAACNYCGENYLVDEADGTQYDIKRTFKRDKSMTVVLTCERRQRGNGSV